MSRAPFALALLFVLSACANAPAGIARMDETQIAAVPDDDICFAVAHGRQTRQTFGGAQTEAARRDLDCSEQMAATVSDCTPLRILNPGAPAFPDMRTPAGPQRIYTASYQVQNASDRPMQFRVVWDRMLSQLQRIGPGETARFLVPVGTLRDQAVADAMPRNAGRVIQPFLQDCTVQRG